MGQCHDFVRINVFKIFLSQYKIDVPMSYKRTQTT